MDIRKEMERLVSQLTEYQKAYYVDANPLVSDMEYDRLYDELKLTVKNGLGSKSVYDIHTIKSIRPTNNALSSPAASLDRLEIKFTDSNEVLRISPKDKQGFIDHICQINANVVVLKK